MIRAKKYTVVFILLILSFISCKKDLEYNDSGLITGPDPRDCICCGGFFIEIGDSTYNFDHLPYSSNIDLVTASFPIFVNLDWQYDRKCGDIQYILITRIRMKYDD